MGTKFSALFRCIGAVALLALAVGLSPQPAAAQANNCLQDEFGKNVQCTANDVKIAAVTNTKNLDGTPITTCNIGTRISFVATYQVVTSSTSSRSNIGLYFATDNQPGDGGKAGGGALTGSCYDNIIPPAPSTHSLNAFCTGVGTPFSFCTGNQTGTSTATFGSSNPTELDPQTPTKDNCGDGNAASSQFVDVVVQNVLCEPTSLTDPHLRLPNCTSWQVPGQTIVCNSPSPTFPWVPAAIPGTGSKCNCGVLEVPIIVQQAKIDVTKTASPTTQTGTDGGPVNYTVVVTNKSNEGPVTINQLCDDKYGNIATAVGNNCSPGSLCPNASSCTGAGTPFPWCTGAGTGNPAGTTCATNITCPLPKTLANPNDTVTCTFTGQIPENTSVTDTVTANAVDQAGNGLSGTASATASAGDAPSTATLTKTFVGTTAGCATLRYGAKVHNSSGGDETLTLSGVGDLTFGSITSVHGDTHTNNSVVGTTCGVDSALKGLGTLVGSSGAGAFNQTLGSDYNCQFDGVICSDALTSITLPSGATCTGIKHSNTLTASLTGDEGETVSQSGGSLTVYECFDATAQ